MHALKNVVPTYCEFLLIDDEGSDFDKDDSTNLDDVDETYDPANEGNPTFDLNQGDDKWMGSRIVKNSGELGDFEGIVYSIDDDENKAGYRLFFVYYFDDPEDGESMWPEELVKYV